MASYDSSDPRQETVTYTGTWERSGRSLTAAAVAGLLGVGVIYSNGQSILATIALFAHGGFHDTLKDGTNLFEWLEHQAEMAKTPIRLSLICSQFLLMLLPTLWIIRHWHTANVRAYLRLHGAPVQTIVAAVAATALFFPTNVYLTELFVSKLGIPQELIIINQKVFTASSPGELVFLFVAIGLTPA